MVVNSLKEVCEGVDMIDRTIHDPFREVVGPLISSGQVVAWKALGAGGGGCAGLLCAPNIREEVSSSVEEAGWQVIDWDYDEQGFTITGE